MEGYSPVVFSSIDISVGDNYFVRGLHSAFYEFRVSGSYFVALYAQKCIYGTPITYSRYPAMKTSQFMQFYGTIL